MNSVSQTWSCGTNFQYIRKSSHIVIQMAKKIITSLSLSTMLHVFPKIFFTICVAGVEELYVPRMMSQKSIFALYFYLFVHYYFQKSKNSLKLAL